MFSQAKFRGSFDGPNTVAEVRSGDGAYPSGYNMSYLDENAAFIQGGSYGDRRELDRPLRGEGRPEDARARLVHAAA